MQTAPSIDLTSLLVTIVLGGISIALAVYFFIRAKDAEKQIAILLTEIKSQLVVRKVLQKKY